MKKISDKEAVMYGIRTAHHEMDNGELRFRLVSDHGSSYILTRGTTDNGWQSSHVHYTKNEFYIVEDGVVFVALLIENEIKLKKLSWGDSLSVPVGIPHNVFICDNAILHTVKFGAAEEDWIAYPALDKLISQAEFSINPKGDII